MTVGLRRRENEHKVWIDSSQTRLVQFVQLPLNSSATDYIGVKSCSDGLGSSGQGDLCLQIPLNINVFVDYLEDCDTRNPSVPLVVDGDWWPLEMTLTHGKFNADAMRISNLRTYTRNDTVHTSFTYTISYSLAIHLSNQPMIFTMNPIAEDCGGTTSSRPACNFQTWSIPYKKTDV